MGRQKGKSPRPNQEFRHVFEVHFPTKKTPPAREGQSSFWGIESLCFGVNQSRLLCIDALTKFPKTQSLPQGGMTSGRYGKSVRHPRKQTSQLIKMLEYSANNFTAWSDCDGSSPFVNRIYPLVFIGLLMTWAIVTLARSFFI